MAINNLTSAARNAALDPVLALINVGGAGTIKIYTSAFGTLLATLTFSATSFGAASAGVATANTITDDSSADATGTAAVFRVASGAGTTIFEGTVGTSGADINFTTVAFVTGAVISITALTMTMPAS